MVVTTLPFGSYENNEQAVETAVRLLKEGGADAVHIEGTSVQAGTVNAIVDAGIPVLGPYRHHQTENRALRIVSNTRSNGRFRTANTRRRRCLRQRRSLCA